MQYYFLTDPSPEWQTIAADSIAEADRKNNKIINIITDTAPEGIGTAEISENELDEMNAIALNKAGLKAGDRCVLVFTNAVIIKDVTFKENIRDDDYFDWAVFQKGQATIWAALYSEVLIVKK